MSWVELFLELHQKNSRFDKNGWRTQDVIHMTEGGAKEDEKTHIQGAGLDFKDRHVSCFHLDFP